MFPSILHLFLHWGAKVYSQNGMGHGRISPMDPPLITIIGTTERPVPFFELLLLNCRMTR